MIPEKTCNHIWASGVVTKESTCSEEGSILYTCVECGDTKVDAIPIDPLNHGDNTTHIENAEDVSCTGNGYTGDIICDGCYKIVAVGTVIAAGHSWDSGVVTKEATCTEEGETLYTCMECGETMTDTTPIDLTKHGNHATHIENGRQPTCTGAGYSGDTVCDGCGCVVRTGTKIAPLCQPTGKEYAVGDKILFGQYPQREVTDRDIIDDLNARITEKDWVSYGYYSGKDKLNGSMTSGDWMLYCDIEMNGKYYRGIKILAYRPIYTTASTSEDGRGSLQKSYGYELDNIYWFLWEPLQWRVLDPSSGLVISEKEVDSQPFTNTIYAESEDADPWLDEYFFFSNDPESMYSANDYATSSIRRWLLDDFYNAAFSPEEQDLIDETQITISEISSLSDKIFLLSTDDLRNTSYGFSAESFDSSRAAQYTDYAKSQGLTDGTTYNYYWLRTPGKNAYNYAVFGGSISSGWIDGDWLNYRTDGGVRPAFQFRSGIPAAYSLEMHTWDDGVVTKEATCRNKGNILYTCTTCGETIIDLIPVNPDNHGDYATHIEDAMTATCTIDGYTGDVRCNGCYKIVTVGTVIAAGHSWDSGVVTKEATCKAKGTKLFTCTACGETKTVSIAKDPNNHASYGTVVKNAVDAGCETEGYTGDVCCKGCGAVLTKGETVPAAGNVDADGDGACDDCGADVRENICPCGKDHTGPFAGLVIFFHKIIYFFKNLFK